MANTKQKFKIVNNIDSIVDASGMVNVGTAYARLSSDCVNPWRGFPCGQCANCLSSHTNRWVARLMHQASISFATLSFCLTYTESMLVNPSVGASRFDEIEYKGRKWFGAKHPMHTLSYAQCATLSKRDFQLFMKRLRSKLPNIGLKYYAKGEYGDANSHPHIHVILNILDCCVIEDVKTAILNAWFDGIEKYDTEEFPNLSRPRNRGKFVKVNPIVSFGEFDEECAKYCTKYVSKASLFDCKPADLIPEFTLCSKGLAVDFYKPQIEEKRKKFDSFAFEWQDLNDSDFQRMFKQILTFQSNTGDTCFFPQFLRTEFFQGYYTYQTHKHDMVETGIKFFVNGYKCYGTKLFHKGESVKTWCAKDGAETMEFVDMESGAVYDINKGEFLQNQYTQMIQRYVTINVNKYFGISDDTLFLQMELIPIQVQHIKTKAQADLQRCKNRVEGAYKKRKEKIKKNSQFLTKK